MIKLLLISPKPPPNGGIARWTTLLLNWLNSNKSINYRHVNTSPRWRTIHGTGFIKRMLAKTFQGFCDLYQIVQELFCFRPSVVHLTTSGSLAGLRDITVLALLKAFRTPGIYHIRFGRIPKLMQDTNWEWILLRSAIYLSSSIITIDNTTYTSLSRICQHKLFLIPNAVDSISFCVENQPISFTVAESIRKHNSHTSINGMVLFLGWVIPTKGIKELIEAWDLIDRSDWKLVIAGPVSNSYQHKLIATIDNPRSVSFLGDIPHELAEKLMMLSDIFVLPSYTEGFPNVILEAMSAGKAIIATNVGAIPEMLEANTINPCGIIIKPHNPGELSSALQRLMTNQKLRFDLGQRANKRAKTKYSLDVVFRQYEELWKTSSTHRTFQSL